MGKKYFLSLQYSGIQKTIFRHSRLWSLAGISSLLSQLNEIQLPEITQKNGGNVLVAGGGKFTAHFDALEQAQKARQQIIQTVSTQFPMLEFQISKDCIPADDLQQAKEPDMSTGHKGLVGELNEKKKAFRGYGLTFNPHLKTCGECVEYPAVITLKRGKTSDAICAICNQAYQEARINLDELCGVDCNARDLTTLKKIYCRFLENLKTDFNVPDETIKNLKIPLDFEDLLPKKITAGEEKKKRMAVWFSDINNMNTKVPIWLAQENIYDIFQTVKQVYIETTADALARTFNPKTCRFDAGQYLPFRIIIAGGDDLCIVMNPDYILSFATNLASEIVEKRNGFEKRGDGNHTDEDILSTDWLKRHRLENHHTKGPIKSYSFGSSFIITNLHTPFSAVHEIGENLMSQAKSDTQRWDNSIN